MRKTAQEELTAMAAGIELVGLTKRFGNRARSASEQTAVDAIDLSVAGG
jgi:hypothetical protein